MKWSTPHTLNRHASGKGDTDYPTDIAIWNDKRIVPHMHTYHISYAALSAKEYSCYNDYIRLLRYYPNKRDLGGTNVPGDHFRTGLFKTKLRCIYKTIKMLQNN